MIVEQFQEFRRILIHTLPVSLSPNKNNGDLPKNRNFQLAILENGVDSLNVL
jgi:peroxiredoxin